MMDKPDVDSIEGLSPAIAIHKKLLVKIRALLLVQLLRFMITCVYFMPELEFLIVQIVKEKYLPNPLKEFVILYSKIFWDKKY
jgi:Excinuclease ABC subunit A